MCRKIGRQGKMSCFRRFSCMHCLHSSPLLHLYAATAIQTGAMPSDVSRPSRSRPTTESGEGMAREKNQSPCQLNNHADGPDKQRPGD